MIRAERSEVKKFWVSRSLRSPNCKMFRWKKVILRSPACFKNVFHIIHGKRSEAKSRSLESPISKMFWRKNWPFSHALGEENLGFNSRSLGSPNSKMFRWKKAIFRPPAFKNVFHIIHGERSEAKSRTLSPISKMFWWKNRSYFGHLSAFQMFLHMIRFKRSEAKKIWVSKS